MDFEAWEQWFGGDPSNLDAACAEIDWLMPDQVSDTAPDDPDWAPLSVAATLAAVRQFGPCAESLRLLESLDGCAVGPDDSLTVAELLQPLRNLVAGRQLSAMVGFAGPTPAKTGDYRDRGDLPVLELALALDVTQDYARGLLSTARALATTLTRTGDLLRSGALSEYKAWVVADRLAHVSPAVAEQVEATLLPKLLSDSPSQLKRRIYRALVKAQGGTAETEHRDGAAKRHVRVCEQSGSEPGLLGLYAALPPETVLAIYARLRQVAAGFDPSDGRTREQRIADAFALLLLGPSEHDEHAPARPRVVVNVTVDLLTLFWLKNHPGELEGYGPIPAGIARELAGDAEAWRRFVHDPVTGHLLDIGAKTYVPTAELARFVAGRDRFGRFPGSSRKAENCDRDHIEAFDRTGNGAGGSTSAANIASQSRTAHRAKTFGGWQVDGDANEELTVTSPTGRRYPSFPHDYRPDPHDPGGPPPKPPPKPPPEPAPLLDNDEDQDEPPPL